MALPILDGNQSATTLSSVVTGGEHIVAHSVVSLGTQAITNISSAISGSTVCVGNLGLLQSTVSTEGLSASGSFIKIGGHTGTSTTGNIVHVSSVGALRVDGSVYTQPVSIASVTIGNTVTIAGTVTANPTGTQTIAGTVTANDSGALSIVNSSTVTKADVKFTTIAGAYNPTDVASSYVVRPLSISSTGKLLIDASADSGGGSVVGYDGNAFIRVAQSPQSVVTVGSLPAISGTVTAGNIPVFLEGLGDEPCVRVGGVGADGAVLSEISNQVRIISSDSNSIIPISGTVTANTFALQGTAVTTSNFTSTTASTVLASFNATREVLTIFNEGAGNLHVCVGATCTTIAYQVRLSAGDYYEVPNHQTTITHSAVFATAGTARVTQVS